MNPATIRKGEATRSRIVDAAYLLFLEQGYHGTSMRQIVERAGITMGGIYNHFAGKEEIWQAVLATKHPYHEILPLLRSAQGDAVADFVRDAATRLVSELGRRPDLLNLMFIELVEFDGKHVTDLYHQILPELQPLAEIFAQKQGRLRPVALPIVARAFAGLFFSFYVTNLLLPPEVHQLMGKDALDAVVDIYLHGILAEEAGPDHV
jgi:AcrR family transcriptional regulator